jgi:hypothetical protein
MPQTLSRIDPDLGLRRVQNIISSKPALTGYPAQAAPLGNSPISTMAPAVAVEPIIYVPLRPVLAPATVDLEDGEQIAIEKFLTEATMIAESDAEPVVKEAYLKIVLKLHNLVEEVAAKHMSHISRQIKLDSAELEVMNAKKTEEIRKHVMEASKETTWSFLSKIMNYFLSAVTVVLGSVLVASGVGATAGAFLIAAGGLGLLNSVANDTGAYQAIASYFSKSKETQERIASWITTFVLFATIGLGMTGGIMTAVSSATEAVRATMTGVDAAKKLEIAIGLASAGVAVGKANSDKNTAMVQKSLQLIEGRIFLMKQALQKNASEVKNTIQMLQAITNQTRQAITAFH